ncbi:hypothetical protein [Clostridium kluyveri]|uniref:Uncharacterized protein n=2 Tax=Clostridium kluyveri TaxID=1534 RepID=A5N604_CLOK5|nr:hypothetical protein [Clostridium kluyveri]EDK32735.1 Hypothetical protein CKL_0682 [Clostridium kluyveri DSM 555]BAH05655.1 hypothetical protein CKR_0604 [Clostridium kluyveri NBRC 12016]
MLFFLYSSAILSILLGTLLFKRQSKKLKNKKFNEKQLLEYWIKRMFVNIIVMCILCIFLLVVLPFLIWLIFPKEVGITDKITETKNLSPISNQSYIKQKINNNVKVYTVNIGTTQKPNLIDFEKNSLEIISTKKESPKYEKIARYKITKLKGNNIISSAVNDIYANIYIQYGEEKFIENKVKIFIPSSDS